jgi:hypothetical protein
MDCTCLTLWWVGSPSPGPQRPSFRVVFREIGMREAAPTGRSSSSGSTTATTHRCVPPSGNAASTAAAATAALVITATDRASTLGCSSGWEACPFDQATDRIGTALFRDLRTGVSEAWAQGSVYGYTTAWNGFVKFCGERVPLAFPLPASPTTMALFLFQKLAEAKSYLVIKTASAAINHAHVLNLLANPTSHQIPGMVRKLAQRRIGSEAKNVKAPFDWAVIGRFATEFARVGQPQFDRC